MTIDQPVVAPEQPVRLSWWQRFSARRVRPWASRLMTVVGIALLVLGLTGWWLSTRVLDDDGFGDVVAQTSQRAAVRNYVADQATLRLAKSSSFVSSARPVVTRAISSAIDAPAVTTAIRSFATGAHRQIFRLNDARRVNVDASPAATTISTSLRSIDPKLAEKLPSSLLNTSATISQSNLVDALARSSTWVRVLYIPVGLLGVALIVLAVVWSDDRTRALRFAGLSMAVAGAFPVGLGYAEPLFAAVGSTADPGRGEAVAAFVNVLLGRLVGAGWAMILVGLLIALAPGRDGGDLPGRSARMRSWFQRRRTEPRWRFAVGGLVIVLAALVLSEPVDLLRAVVFVVGVAGLYVGIILVLRSARLLESQRPAGRIRRRQLAGVAALMVIVFGVSTAGAVAVVAVTTPSGKADPRSDGCNGSVELCLQRLDQVVWPGSHNSMSSSAYDFFGAEHTITIEDQLNAGAKVLLLDVYYGYDDHGLVRTNLAGGVDRAKLKAEFGTAGTQELDRLGALTGSVDTSGKKKDIYFCHDLCELGAVKAKDVLEEIRRYLERNLTDVLILDFEDYVEPADLKKVLDDAGLGDRVWTRDSSTKQLPTLLDMTTAPAGQDENKRRLITTSERHGGVYPWLPDTYNLMQETPYTFTAISQFTCSPNRGKADNPLLLINHWLRPNGPPDPKAAADVNSEKTLRARIQQCIAVRKRLPNILAIDFTAVGDLYKTVDEFNAAIAYATGTTQFWDQTIQGILDDPTSTTADQTSAKNLKRLPAITRAQALALLGPEAPRLVTPDLVKLEQEINALPDVPGSTPSPSSTPSSTAAPSPSASPTR